MKKIIIILIVMLSAGVNAQRKYAADRYFKEFNYIKAAELYTDLYEKGDTSYTVVSRLGDTHYYNAEFETAEKWYTELTNKYASDDTMNPEHIFRYAQTLKTNGKIEESDKWLEKLKEVNKEDSRVSELEANRDYFTKYSTKENTFVNINNLQTNTEYSDFGAFVYDNNLYFASTKPKNKKDIRLYAWNKQPYLNIYKAQQKEFIRNDILKVNESELINDISSPYHESNMVITKDGKTAYFTRDNYDGRKLRGDDKEVSHLKMYRTQKVDDKWQKAVELSFNSDNYSTGHPALSPDEKTLYFVSDRPNGFGGTDIYKVAVLENGGFGEVQNLGGKINTEAREMFPFISADNTLFFSSDGHIGLGALDVFEAKLKNNEFTQPVNLGAPVNGAFDDFSFLINAEKSYGYFSSNRKGGKGDDDIYSFTINQCNENIVGIATDKLTQQPLANVKVNLIDANGAVVASATTTANGAYAFDMMECETSYTLTGDKQDYRSAQTTTTTLNVDAKQIKTSLELENLIVADKIVIRPIYFDFDLHNIREDAEYELEQIVTVLKNHPNMVIKIESHTDSRGTHTYNQKLSERRAKSTRDYILSRGITKTQIESAKGYGESQLLNHCSQGNKSKCTKEEHQINRRSYFIIVKGGANIKVVDQKQQ